MGHLGSCTLAIGAKMNTNHGSRLALLLTASMWLGACASTAVRPDEVAALRSRVDELERQVTRARSSNTDLEERVFLLQDRVEAARIALQRRGPEGVRTAVHIGLDGSASPSTLGQSSRATTPSAWANPPPRPEVDPLAALPVQRVGPPQSFEPAPEAPSAGPEEEVVITMDHFQARFGATPGAGGSQASHANNGAGERRQGLPPVDTRGMRLPVSDNVPTSPLATPAAAAVPVSATVSASPTSTAATGLALYRSALDQFNQGDYTASLQSLNAFLESRPEADYMDNALFWIGECYYGMGRYNEALGYFQRVVSEYPDGNKVPDSLLKVALTYERLDNVRSATDVLRVLTDTYPSTDAATRAAERLRALQ